MYTAGITCILRGMVVWGLLLEEFMHLCLGIFLFFLGGGGGGGGKGIIIGNTSIWCSCYIFSVTLEAGVPLDWQMTWLLIMLMVNLYQQLHQEAYRRLNLTVRAVLGEGLHCFPASRAVKWTMMHSQMKTP